MDPATLAAAAVGLVAPYLAELGKGAAKKAGEEGGSTVFGWLKAKLGASGQEALHDLAANPDDADNQADLRKRIVKALEADPPLAADLEKLLPATTSAGDVMQQTLGEGAKANMTSGDHNTSMIVG